MGKRSVAQKAFDFITFPLRAFTLFFDDRLGLSAMASERFDYAADEVIGYCLDVGCGRYNRFVTEYLHGKGIGVDVYPYEGLNAANLIEDLSRFPWNDSTFNTVTFIASLNHIPKSQRDAELGEAYRVTKSPGNIVVTMGNPLAAIVVHKVVWLYDRIFKTRYDVDSERGMGEEEEYYLTDAEITDRLAKAGFGRIQKKYMVTEWGFNHLFVGWKE